MNIFFRLFSLLIFAVFSNLNAQVFISESFEDWEDIGDGYNQPEGWFSSNAFDALFGDPQGIVQSSNSHDGNYAAQLTVYDAGENGVSGSFINLTAPIGGNPAVISGWHTYNLGSDTILLRAPIFSYDEENDTSTAVGLAIAEFSGQLDEYTYFSIPFDIAPISIADTLRMIITFANIDLTLGSSYTIDDIRVDASNSIKEQAISDIPCYPNPASEKLSFYISKDLQSAHLQVLNALGQVCYTTIQDYQKGTFSLNLENFPAGMYCLSIRDSNAFRAQARFIHTK
ncbi:MAG: T9SS type A sorting domain-containing protein [Bacteroidia bacterium]